MTDSNIERVVTHRVVAKVARLMGYTPQGLKDLCETCNVKTEWVTIGITRATNERVAARLNSSDLRLEFSVGPNAFALTANAREAQRIRNEIAEAVVNRVKASRPALNPRFIKANLDPQPADDQGRSDALSRPETMIISPVAPRDPRGPQGAQRGHTGPGNTMSEA